MKTLRHAAYRTRETYSRSCEQPCAISRRDRCALYKQSSINYWPWADAPGTLIIETQLRHARVSLPVAIWLSLLRYSPHYRVNCQFRILLVSIKSKINVATAVWLLAMRIYLFIYLFIVYGKGYWDKQIYMLQNIFTDLIYKYRCVILLINFICPGRFWMFCIYMLWNVLQLNDYTVHCNIFMTRLVPLMADENSLYHWGCITYEIRCSFFFLSVCVVDRFRLSLTEFLDNFCRLESLNGIGWDYVCILYSVYLYS